MLAHRVFILTGVKGLSTRAKESGFGSYMTLDG